MRTIKECFDTNFKSLKIDNNFVLEIEGFLNSILTKNENSVKFFTCPLVGVYQVFFDNSDVNYLWGIIVEADKDDLKDDLHSVPYIKPNWNVGADPTNHLLFYLVHRVMTSSLPEKNKINTATILLVILQYKFVTSLSWRDYKYPVDRELALTVYNKLSRRFILRQVNTWREFFFTQATNMLLGTDKRKDMMTIIKKYNDDRLITNTITGIQSNLNDMFVEYNAVFYEVKDESGKITLDTGFGNDSEGNQTYAENTSNNSRYLLFLEGTVSKLNTWMDDELITLTTIANKSRYKPVRKSLVYISENYGGAKHPEIREFVNGTLMFGLDKINECEGNIKDIKGVQELLAGRFSANRSLDPTLEKLKELGSDIILSSDEGKMHNNTVTLTRTTIMIYIVLFALVKL